jgi:hypothetical protein
MTVWHYFRKSKKRFAGFLALSLLFLFPATQSGNSVEKGAEDQPMLTVVDAPSTFRLNDLPDLALFVRVEAINIGPLTEGMIDISVSDLAGAPIGVPILNRLSATDLFFGRDLVAIEIGYASPIRGSSFPVLICASSKVLPGNPCAVVQLLDDGNPLDRQIKAKEELQKLLKENFPGIGCRCKSAVIRMEPANASHGTLGTFTLLAGGVQYGEFHGTNNSNGTFTSVYKFEPHFEIEILNRPPKPAGFSEDGWTFLQSTFPALCDEGQNVNGTTTTRKGLPDEKSVFIERETLVATESFPYEDTTDPKKFTQDGQGYRSTGQSLSPSVQGRIKTWDANIIHWLDAPGFASKPQAIVRKAIPISQKNQFHAFVHGTTGKDEDDCDCFFGLETGVVDLTGAEASRLLKKPECK